jgi:hypothetical protein
MPLTTEGLIDELQRFRADKMALVALLGSMGQESEIDALARLRYVQQTAADWLVAHRRKPKAGQREDAAQQRIWQGVYDLTREAEPWLAAVVEREGSHV